MIDPLEQAIREVSAALESMRVRHVIVGSVATFAHGVYRSTADGDLLAEIAPQQSSRLALALGKSWYVDTEMIERAIQEGRSFNVIHIPTAQKIDIFPARTDFHGMQVKRAVKLPLFARADGTPMPVASAEDTVLAKLIWYREGGEVSEKQWADITGVLATKRNLDFDYLRPWAIRLRVSDLLDKALAEVQQDT